MSDCVVEACKDCMPWVCNTNQKCTYEDKNFELLSKKILGCGALVIGTPVYWGDTTGMVRYLFLKMYRVFAGSGQLKRFASVRYCDRRWQWKRSHNRFKAPLPFLQDNADAGN